MIEINQSLLIQIINVLLLMWLLNVILYKPIRGILKQRGEKLALLEAEAAAAQKGLADKEKDYSERLLAARKEGLDYKNELKLKAQEEEKNLVQAANQKVEGELTQARQKISQQLEAARKSLTGDLSAFSQEIATKILGRTI
jgi:F-type H+-transporting ATPase subunit b